MNDAKAVLFPVLAVLCLAAVLLRLGTLRTGRRDPAAVALVLAFAAKFVAFVLATPFVAAAVDQHVGIPDFGALGIHLLGGILFGAAVLTAVAYWTHPPATARKRRLWYAGSGVLIAVTMVVLWTVTAVESQDRATHYLVQRADRPLVDIYLLLYVTALLAALVEIARICLRYARLAERAWLKRGLYTTALGAMIYSVNFLDRALSIVAVHFGLDPLDWEIVVVLGLAFGMPLIIFGLTVPSWGPRLSAVATWFGNLRAYRTLYPIWSALFRAMPTIALDPPGSSWADLDYRLCRRIIEIRDGMLALRRYQDPRVAALARQQGLASGLAGEDLHAVVEAAQFKAALRARASNEESDTPHPVDHPPPSDFHGGDDLAGEAAWLMRIAKAYTHSPIVDAASRAPLDTLIDRA